jgi:tight adherence protein B
VRNEYLAATLAAAAVLLAAAAGREARRRSILRRAGRADVATSAAGAEAGSAAIAVSGVLPLAMVGGLFVGWFVFGPVGAVAGIGLGVAVAHAIRRRRAVRTRVRIEAQVADAVAAVAAGVRGGLSVTQAVAHAADRTPEPLAASLRHVVDRTRLGSSLDDALERWATAIPVPDVRLVAAVLRLHRGTGGGFPNVLDGLGRTLRERRAAIREVRSLTAQARLSGAILGLLPVAFFLFLWMTSRHDMMVALGSPVGRTAIVVGVLLQGIAFLWIRRLLRVEA